MLPRREGVLLAATLVFVACEEEVHEARLSEGTYRVVYGDGYEAADEARLLAVRARLDRATGQLVFTMAEGSQQTLAFSPRPREQWEPDCFTMASHFENEVADLSPRPLQVESLTFATPIVFAKCSRLRTQPISHLSTQRSRRWSRSPGSESFRRVTSRRKARMASRSASLAAGIRLTVTPREERRTVPGAAKSVASSFLTSRGRSR